MFRPAIILENILTIAVFVLFLFHSVFQTMNAHFNDIVFVLFGRVAQQKLTNDQFVEWIWELFCVANNIPFD